MKKFKFLQSYLLFTLILGVFLIAGCGGGGGSDSLAPAPASTKAITAYSFTKVGTPSAPITGGPKIGTINEAAKTIAVTVPFGTDVTTLVAAFTTTGAAVKIGTPAVTQVSGDTSNNFTTSKAYVVTAANGTTATYTVTVTVAANSAKAITAYSFAAYPGAIGTINEVAKTIAVTVPSGTNVTALVATYTSTGVSENVGVTLQTSGTTANTFAVPLAFKVTAADGSTATYTITVTVALLTDKAITAYFFAGYTGATGVINEALKTIAVTVPFGTDVTTLVATFATTGTIVKIGAAVQTSAATANNFTGPLLYTVTAADGSTATYTITVTVAANSAKAITAYSFAGYTGATGVINEVAKTIAVTVPFGTNVTALIATFTTTGTIVKIGAAVETSGATANNFTAPVFYTVTAADLSTATYTITVTVAANSAKAITAYSFAGYPGATGIINEASKNIAVTVPFGTNVTALVATYTSTGVSENVGVVLQTSGVTPNNFPAPPGFVAYVVTAADGTTATYNVTVTVAANTAKAITAFSLNGHTGTINEASKNISVGVPSGTNVTALIATFTTTGNKVEVGAVIQTSGVTANNFTAPVLYKVTAADLSTATYTVTVTITIAPDLGAATPFGSFGGGAGMTNTGLQTVVNGDIGTTGASTTMTGFHDSVGGIYTETPANTGNVTGRIYTAAPPPGGSGVGGNAATYAIALAGANDALIAYNNISPASLPGGIDPGAGQLGGLTLAPGIYMAAGGAFLLTGLGAANDLTLDGQGDPNAVWVFQMASSLTVGAPGVPAVTSRSVILKNGAQSKNIFWYVGSAATINPAGGGTMEGTIISSAGIAFSTVANTTIVTLNGRAIALNASTTLVDTVINVPAP